MRRVQCAVCSVEQNKVFSVQCEECSGKCAVCSAVQNKVFIVQVAVGCAEQSSAQFAVCNAEWVEGSLMHSNAI